MRLHPLSAAKGMQAFPALNPAAASIQRPPPRRARIHGLPGPLDLRASKAPFGGLCAPVPWGLIPPCCGRCSTVFSPVFLAASIFLQRDLQHIFFLFLQSSACWRFFGAGSSFASLAALMQLDPRPVLAPFLVATPPGCGSTQRHHSRLHSPAVSLAAPRSETTCRGGLSNCPRRSLSWRASHFHPPHPLGHRPLGLTAGLIGVLAWSLRGGPMSRCGIGWSCRSKTADCKTASLPGPRGPCGAAQ